MREFCNFYIQKIGQSGHKDKINSARLFTFKRIASLNLAHLITVVTKKQLNLIHSAVLMLAIFMQVKLVNPC